MIDGDAIARFSELTLPGPGYRLFLLSCPGVRFNKSAARVSEAFLSADMNKLSKAGIRLILSCLDVGELTLGPDRYASAYRRHGIDWLVVPIPDMTPPTPEVDVALDLALIRVERVLQAGLGVGIHCMAGLGRTGTVAARFAMQFGLSAPQAIELIRTKHDRQAIETPEQETYLHLRDLKDRPNGERPRTGAAGNPKRPRNRAHS
ncbi:MAG: dual specificity protein phosphatase family protein [Nitratireductor sp.]